MTSDWNDFYVIGFLLQRHTSVQVNFFWKLQVSEVQRLLLVFHELISLILGKFLSFAFEGKIKGFLWQLIPSE
jgi:hypothetical protein